MTTNYNKNVVLTKSKNSYFFSFLLLVLMIATLLILRRSEQELKELEKERGISEAKERLQLDLKLLQKSTSLEMHLGNFIYHQLIGNYSNIKNEKNWPTKLDVLIRNSINPIWQKSQWLIMSFDEPLVASESLFADKRVTVKVSQGSDANKYSEELKFLCIKGINNFSNLMISPDYRKKLNERLSDIVDSRVATDQTNFILAAFACFQKIHLYGKPFRVAWFPLIDPKWINSFERFRKINRQYFDSRDLNVTYLSGIALFLLTEKNFTEISIKYLKPLIRANLSKTGCKIEFYEKNTRNIKALESGELRLNGMLTLDRDYKIVLSRKSKYDPNKNRLARTVGFFLKIAWFAVGLLLWGHFFLMKRQINANINSQLIVFTTWILFPAFYLGYSATERYVLEKQTSTLSELKKKLSDHVRAVDNSLDLYKTWACDVIERSVDKHFHSMKIDLANKDDTPKMILELKKDLIQNGVFAKNIFLVDSSGNIYSEFLETNKKENPFLEKIFKAFYLPVVNSSARKGQKTSKNTSQLLAGAQFEELISIVRNVLLPEEVSAIAMKTVSLDRITGMNQQAFIFHKYLGKDKKAFIAIQVVIYMQSIERSCMLDWTEFLDQEKLSGLIWFITRKKAPSWLLRAPFGAANSSSISGHLVFVADFLGPGLLFLNHQLTQSKLSLTTTIEMGSQEFLLASYPGQKMDKYQISALIPLQPRKNMLANFRIKLLWAMAIIFLMSAIIGIKLARSFIKPVETFAAKALQVITGNFKVRMPEIWEDQEFISLATNFNQVIANLDSGKTLSKFVSDGALEVIRNSACLEKNCFAIDQIIMFVRLDQFWEKTEDLSPEQAVYILNLFFAMVCREIKNFGGDVSKFIGEKVLAVFNTHKSNSYELAALCALKIKREVELNSPKYQNCRVRIGLSLGKVFSGVIGSEDSLLEQTVIGDTVNLASRLCTIFSEHSILINEPMAHFLIEGTSKAKLELLPEQQIKGKKSPVKIFSLIGYP